MPDSTSCGTLVADAQPQIGLVAHEACCSCDDCGSNQAKTGVSMSDGRADVTIPINRWLSLKNSARILQDCAQATTDQGFGNNIMTNIPHAVAYNDTSVAVVFGPKKGYWFDTSENSFAPQFGAKVVLTHDAGNDMYVLVTKSGHTWEFHDYTVAGNEKGKLRSMTTPGGQTLEATYDGSGYLTELSMTFTVPGPHATDSVTESVVFTYANTGATGSQVATVTLRRKVNEEAYTLISRSILEYYTEGARDGSLGDLKTVTKEVAQGGEFSETGTYLMTYSSGSLLREFLSPESYRRYLAGQGGIENYADFAFEYNEKRKVTQSVAKAGTFTTTYAYTTSANAAAANNWAQKVVKTNPDGSVWTGYFNYVQQSMLGELADASPSTDTWVHYREYSTSYFLPTLIAEASAVNTFNDAVANLDVDLFPSAGKIETRSYYGAGAIGYENEIHLKEGSSGTPILQKKTTWTSRTGGSITIWYRSLVQVYRDTAGTQNIDTAFSYTWHGSTVQAEQRTTTPPVIPTSQNGDNTTYTRKEIFDELGVLIWTQDELGFITYRGAGAHRVRLGGPNAGGVVASTVQTIRDVDMTAVSGLPEQPNWTTPADGGLMLTSDFEVDDFGRTTQSLRPVHDVDGQSVRTASWTVYKDPEHEVWNARGYIVPALGKGNQEYLVNPVSIQKMDHNGRTTDSIQAVRDSVEGSLSPHDEFPQSSYCRWSTSHYDNAGELTAQRQYTSIPDAGSGSAGTNYLETTFAYDSMDRRNRVEDPTGTINRTVFDVRSHAIETWIGSNRPLIPGLIHRPASFHMRITGPGIASVAHHSVSRIAVSA